MDIQHPQSLARVTVHRSAPFKRYVLWAVVVVMYGMTVSWCYNTMGEPLKVALEQMKIQEVDQEITRQSQEWDSWDNDNPDAEIDPELVDEPPPHVGSNDDLNEELMFDNDDRPLPDEYLPDAWALASLMALVTFHALFHLLCHWLVWFRAKSLFNPSYSVNINCYVHVETHKHRGKEAICPFFRFKHSKKLGFEFQRQKYEFVPPAGELSEDGEGIEEREESEDEKESEFVGKGKENGAARLLHSPVDRPIGEYIASRGLTNELVETLTETFGKNEVSVATPRFMKLLQEQLIAPISIFQFFTTFLWLLDASWQYSIWTLVSIVLMAGCTAVQRLRTMKILNGMNTTPSPVQTYRNGCWIELGTNDLLPGDLISLSLSHMKKKIVKKESKVNAAKTPPSIITNVIPCDCVLLRGTAVVNEATLTGESVPQMKDALVVGNDKEDIPLAIQGDHRVHVVFSGTTLVSAQPGRDKHSSKGLPQTPNGGCLASVIRTGFSSSQGELIQMINYSTHQVSGDSKETLVALGLLLIFAIFAAGYVLKTGLEKGNRTTHELLVRCVLILTSVVPTQLPMQMSVAINTALMKLMKDGIFCTEPYRVPYSGKITHCLFDKTGTLTTDQLVPVGVVNAELKQPNSEQKSHQFNASQAQTTKEVKLASPQAAMILGACHSLIAVEGVEGLLGDPIELAAIKGIEWQYDATTQTARPGNWSGLEKSLINLRNGMTKMADDSPEKKSASKKVIELQQSIDKATASAARSPTKFITIQHRYHFSSKLQRMSVLCNVRGKLCPNGSSGRCCMVKGSPEALQPLLVEGGVPTWFEITYRVLAEKGMRVLALAYKWIDSDEMQRKQAFSREWVESELYFAGFIAFACKTRKDSRMVIGALQESDHAVAMLTGDAALTALHVAKEVGICNGVDKTALLLTATKKSQSEEEEPVVEWVGAVSSSNEKFIFDAEKVPTLSKSYDFMVTEASLNAAIGQSNGKFWDHVDCVKVFARMSPQGKAKVVREMQERKKHYVLMCGDGGNDVGALKQADVGLALLSGYGNVNTGDSKTDSMEFVETVLSMELKTKLTEVQTDDLSNCIKNIIQKRMTKQKKVRVKIQQNSSENYDINVKVFNENASILLNDMIAMVGLRGIQGFFSELQSAISAKDKSLRITLPTIKVSPKVSKPSDEENQSSEQALNEESKKLKYRESSTAKLKKALLAAKHKDLNKKYPERLAEEMEKRRQRGEDTGVFAHIKAVMTEMKRTKQEMHDEAVKLNKQYGNVYDKKVPKNASDAMSAAFDEMDDDPMPVVRPGDASVAAPFTSRSPSVRSAVHLIRQGRCTLLSSLQQQQIMMLESFIMAYSLSALSVEGARSSERQMLVSNWLLVIASLAFSYSAPVDRMHPLRPLRSLFHPAIFLSMLGQAIIHLGCLVYAVNLARTEMGEEKLKEVLKFHQRARAGLQEAVIDDEDPLAEIMSLWAMPFLPNLMNTIVFLVQTSQTVAILFVNYKGRPWMKGVLENHPLFLSIFICVAGVASCAWGISPKMNAMMHLEAFPSDSVRWQVMTLVAVSLIGTFIWDRIITCFFAPKIFKVMVEQARATRFKDVWPVIKTALKVGVVVGMFASANIWICLAVGFFYRQHSKKKQAQEQQAMANANET